MLSLKKLKRPLVFVPMAADLFHHGHINILLKAKKVGYKDAIIVALEKKFTEEVPREKVLKIEKKF